MGGKSVTAPDGSQWQVRRRWLDRPLPDVRRRFREYRESNAGDSLLDGAWSIDFADSIWASIALALFLVLVVIVLLPLLGIALELILLLLLLGSGLVGRVVLRRPWTVEAVNLEDKERSASYAIKGWNRSGRAIAEIATAIRAAGPPQQIAEGVKVS